MTDDPIRDTWGGRAGWAKLAFQLRTFSHPPLLLPVTCSFLFLPLEMSVLAQECKQHICKSLYVSFILHSAVTQQILSCLYLGSVMDLSCSEHVHCEWIHGMRHMDQYSITPSVPYPWYHYLHRGSSAPSTIVT